MNRILASIALFLVSAAALADTSDHPVTLWVAEGDSNRIYLLGSVHLLRQEDHPLPAIIDTAYDDAESVYMELDMDDLDPVAVQSTVNRLGVLSDGRTLKSIMGERSYAKAQAAADEADIPLDLLDSTEPWLAAISIEQMMLMSIGFDQQYGIETYMTSKAQEDGKPIHGFESFEEQIRFLDELSLDTQKELLMHTLYESADIESTMDEMIEAWRHGDTAYIEDTMLAEIAEYPELHKTIVVDRNRRWADSIDNLLDDADDYLIVVGALHLVGDDGLPSLLQDRGVDVKQLRQQGDSID